MSDDFIEFHKPMAGTRREDDQRLIAFGAHGDCGIVAAESVDDIFDGVAHCTGCGEHYELRPSPEDHPDFVAWAVDILRSRAT